MDRKPRAPSRSTSLPLILLIFLVGIALGWLLRDVFRGSSAPLPTPAPRPTVATAPTRAPTAAGDQPTALPQPTAAAPQSTRFPTATAAPAPTEQPQPAASPSAPPAAPPLGAPTAAPAEQTIAGYTGHVVGAGETLATIAERGGSRPDLIARY
ncbi:MAG TPA: hypothetical protein VF897_08580, partial [Roseiflexaceae bacterium]